MLGPLEQLLWVPNSRSRRTITSLRTLSAAVSHKLHIASPNRCALSCAAAGRRVLAVEDKSVDLDVVQVRVRCFTRAVDIAAILYFANVPNDVRQVRLVLSLHSDRAMPNAIQGARAAVEQVSNDEPIGHIIPPSSIVFQRPALRFSDTTLGADALAKRRGVLVIGRRSFSTTT